MTDREIKGPCNGVCTQLQACKEENKLFKNTIKKFNLDWYEEELDTLTQQNKQMREILNDLHIFFSKVQFCDIEQDDVNELVSIARKIPQALGGE